MKLKLKLQLHRNKQNEGKKNLVQLMSLLECNKYLKQMKDKYNPKIKTYN